MENKAIRKGLLIPAAVVGMTLSSMIIAQAAENESANAAVIMAADEPTVPLPDDNAPADPVEEAPVIEEPDVPVPTETEEPIVEEPEVPLPVVEEPTEDPTAPTGEAPTIEEPVAQSPAPVINEVPGEGLTPVNPAPVAPVISAPVVGSPVQQVFSQATTPSQTVQAGEVTVPAPVAPVVSAPVEQGLSQEATTTTAVPQIPESASYQQQTPTQNKVTGTEVTTSQAAINSNETPVFHTGNAGYSTANAQVTSTPAIAPISAGTAIMLASGIVIYSTRHKLSRTKIQAQ